MAKITRQNLFSLCSDSCKEKEAYIKDATRVIADLEEKGYKAEGASSRPFKQEQRTADLEQYAKNLETDLAQARKG